MDVLRMIFHHASMDNSTPETAPVTVNMILDKFEADYMPRELQPRTHRQYVAHLRTLRRVFGHRIASELKPKDFGPFLNIPGRGRVQRLRQLAVLSSAFSQAVSFWYMLDYNVLKSVKRAKMKPRDRLVSDEEFEGCKAIAPLRVRLAMDLALITGQRQGDILNFKWSDIHDLPQPVKDEKTGHVITQAIHVQQAKKGKRIGIGITKPLEAVLDRCWQLPNRGEYVLTRKFIGGRYTGEGFRALWQRVQRKWVRLGNKGFHFHDLRALAATKCPTPEDARRLLGHTTVDMTLRVYRRGTEYVTPQTV